jgi:hypothetical protein
MEACFCKFKGCCGTEVPIRTHQYHKRKDRLAALVAPYNVGRPHVLTPPVPRPPSLPPNAIVQILPSPAEAPPSPRPPSPLSMNIDDFSPVPLEPSLDELGLAYEQELTGGCSMPELADISSDESEEDDEDEDEPEEDQTMRPPPDDHPGSRPSSMPNVGAFRLREPVTSDPRYSGENDIDPFYEPPQLHRQARVQVGQVPNFLFLLYILVAWLHTQCKVAFKACNVVLVVVMHILASAGAVDLRTGKAAYESLQSVLRNMDVEPDLKVLPVCPACQEPYPASREGPFLCSRCNTPVFSVTSSHDSRRANVPRLVKPILQCPYMSIEAQLRAILAVPGMVNAMDGWRSSHRTAGQYHDMFDGLVARQVRGVDGEPFFINPLIFPDGHQELRIGLVLGFDWYVRPIFW